MTTYQRQNNPFLSARPYVYAIMWTELNVAYLGVRYRGGCHPSDLWTTYFTSSKYVENFRQLHGDPDHIEIIGTYLTASEAIKAEADIIGTFELHKNPAFLNKNCVGAIHIDDDVRAKISAALKGRPSGKKGQPGHNKGKKYKSYSKQGQYKRKPCSEETRAKMRAAHANRSAETRGKISAALKGRKQTTETREKIAASLRARNLSSRE